MLLFAGSHKGVRYHNVMMDYYVYILGSRTGTLYVGMTNNIKRRVHEHKTHCVPGFTDRYRVDQLLYVERLNDPTAAIAREKQIKRWRREKKVKLVDSINPQWQDLATEWYE